jgi:hypothetical protein
MANAWKGAIGTAAHAVAKRFGRNAPGSAHVKGFGCWPNERRCRRLRGPASESLRGRKPREWMRVSVLRTLSYRGLECAHNSDVTARILLNGDLMFCASRDFKRSGVAKIARSTTDARRLPRQILKRITPIRLEDRNGSISRQDASARYALDDLLTIAPTASPRERFSPMGHSGHQRRPDPRHPDL